MPDSSSTVSQHFLILGGAGFIGRNLVAHLVNDVGVPPMNIRVVDKTLLSMSWLNSEHMAALEKTEFRQVNLASEESIQRAFERTDENKWDFVVNLAAETKLSLSPEVYDQRVKKLTVNCALESARCNVKVFIEVSTAQVYDSNKASDEDGKIAPWTNLAKAKYAAETELKSIQGLNYVIIRPAIVYGKSDAQGITPRLIMGRIYKFLDAEMKLMWTKELRINTVHVTDVCRAIHAICQYYMSRNPTGDVFNLADKEDTCQETINTHIRSIFGISTGFHGVLVSNLARVNLASVTEEANDAHMQPWSQLLAQSDIHNSPLTPYLDQELLLNNSLSAEGSKIERVVPGFKYSCPKITEGLLREVIDDYKAMNLWPKD